MSLWDMAVEDDRAGGGTSEFKDDEAIQDGEPAAKLNFKVKAMSVPSEQEVCEHKACTCHTARGVVIAWPRGA